MLRVVGDGAHGGVGGGQIATVEPLGMGHWRVLAQPAQIG